MEAFLGLPFNMIIENQYVIKVSLIVCNVPTAGVLDIAKEKGIPTLLIDRKTFKEIGEFNEEGHLEMVKAEWAMSAIECGCKFKAILGSKMC